MTIWEVARLAREVIGRDDVVVSVSRDRSHLRICVAGVDSTTRESIRQYVEKRTNERVQVLETTWV